MGFLMFLHYAGARPLPLWGFFLLGRGIEIPAPDVEGERRKLTRKKSEIQTGVYIRAGLAGLDRTGSDWIGLDSFGQDMGKIWGEYGASMEIKFPCFG